MPFEVEGHSNKSPSDGEFNISRVSSLYNPPSLSSSNLNRIPHYTAEQLGLEDEPPNKFWCLSIFLDDYSFGKYVSLASANGNSGLLIVFLVFLWDNASLCGLIGGCVHWRSVGSIFSDLGLLVSVRWPQSDLLADEIVHWPVQVCFECDVTVPQFLCSYPRWYQPYIKQCCTVWLVRSCTYQYCANSQRLRVRNPVIHDLAGLVSSSTQRWSESDYWFRWACVRTPLNRSRLHTELR